MTVFLIKFDRREGRLVAIEPFPDDRRDEAEDARFRAELDALETGQDLEIVTLEAGSIEELKKTHGSYFRNEVPALPV
jgi:hypothetical protein